MKKNYSGLVILNTVTLLIMLFANYAGSTAFFSEQNVGEVSDKYDTLFAPAGYAFIIWGLIFLLCICFVFYQWILLGTGRQYYIRRTGLWFATGNISNAMWVCSWTHEMMGLSVGLILLLLFSLIILTARLRLELDDEPVRNIFFVWWPITFYLGWIMVATIACIAAWLVSTGWNAPVVNESMWTIVLIIIATLLYLSLIAKRNMREAALVGAWAFIALAVRQWYFHKEIAYTAVITSVILLAASGMHAYKNRRYSIVSKLMRGEW